jgi:predicted metal-binding protein
MPRQKDLEGFVQRVVELGAMEAKVVDPATVVTAAWVRWKCQYGCGMYGSSLCCPPHSPTPEQTRALLDCYQRAILAHFKPGQKAKPVVVALEREIFLAGYYRAFALGEGPCFLCKECNLERCIHAYEARPAMEACGIDVYATARANGFPIEVVTDRQCDQNYYGLVLVD